MRACIRTALRSVVSSSVEAAQCILPPMRIQIRPSMSHQYYRGTRSRYTLLQRNGGPSNGKEQTLAETFCCGGSRDCCCMRRQWHTLVGEDNMGAESIIRALDDAWARNDRGANLLKDRRNRSNRRMPWYCASRCSQGRKLGSERHLDQISSEPNVLALPRSRAFRLSHERD